jgi:hypothetical protein
MLAALPASVQPGLLPGDHRLEDIDDSMNQSFGGELAASLGGSAEFIVYEEETPKGETKNPALSALTPLAQPVTIIKSPVLAVVGAAEVEPGSEKKRGLDKSLPHQKSTALIPLSSEGGGLKPLKSFSSGPKDTAGEFDFDLPSPSTAAAAAAKKAQHLSLPVPRGMGMGKRSASQLSVLAPKKLGMGRKPSHPVLPSHSEHKYNNRGLSGQTQKTHFLKALNTSSNGGNKLVNGYKSPNGKYNSNNAMPSLRNSSKYNSGGYIAPGRNVGYVSKRPKNGILKKLGENQHAADPLHEAKRQDEERRRLKQRKREEKEAKKRMEKFLSKERKEGDASAKIQNTPLKKKRTVAELSTPLPAKAKVTPAPKEKTKTTTTTITQRTTSHTTTTKSATHKVYKKTKQQQQGGNSMFPEAVSKGGKKSSKRYDKPLKRRSSKPKGDTWTCATCTYQNPEAFLQCEMCTSVRPPEKSSKNSKKTASGLKMTKEDIVRQKLAFMGYESKSVVYKSSYLYFDCARVKAKKLPKRYVCSRCVEPMTMDLSLSDLKKHMMTHSRTKVLCVCGRKFVLGDEITRHQKKCNALK